MKKSIRIKLTVIVSFLLIALIVLSWLANRFLLVDYYQNRKVKLLNETYSNVNELANADEDFSNSDTINGIERIEAADNVSVYVISGIAVNVFGRTGLYYVYPISLDMNESVEMSFLRNDKYRRITEALQRYVFGAFFREDSSTELLETKENAYDVYKFYDADVDSYYIDLVGYLDNKYVVFIRSSFENIQESARIASAFLAIVGLIIITIGIIAMIFISKNFTKPVLELAEISDKMAALDFENKYEGKRKDEIGKLGKSINMLSDRLELTITELKTANLELEHDIAHKVEIDEMRKEFLSNVSHELKTPIALIQGYAEGLQDNINDDDAESRNFYCEVIIDEAK